MVANHSLCDSLFDGLIIELVANKVLIMITKVIYLISSVHTLMSNFFCVIFHQETDKIWLVLLA